MHVLIYRSTFILLGLSWVIAVFWCLSKPDFEPALTAFALLATITGIFAERWFAKKELREQLFGMMLQEIQLNTITINSHPFVGVLDGTEKIFFPRLFSDAMDTFIISGEFSAPTDRPFLYTLYRHRQVIHQVNRKIASIELNVFISNLPTETKSRYFEALLAQDGPISEVREDLVKIEQTFKRLYPGDYAKALNLRFGSEVLQATKDA